MVKSGLMALLGKVLIQQVYESPPSSPCDMGEHRHSMDYEDGVRQ